MLKFVLVTKSVVEFSLFKLLPSFFLLNASLEHNTSQPQLVFSPTNEVSLDNATSAYAVIEDGFFLNNQLSPNNEKLKPIAKTLSFLSAHQYADKVDIKKTNRTLEFVSGQLVTGGNFNWAPWYRELKNNGLGLVVEQQKKPLVLAPTKFSSRLLAGLGEKKIILSKFKGKFFLRDGLFLNAAKIFIYQSLNGLKVLEAKVSYSTAEFFFKGLIPGAKIVAELRSLEGELLGFSEILVRGVKTSKLLNIRDISSGVRAKVLSGSNLWGRRFAKAQASSNSSVYIESLDRQLLRGKRFYQDKNLSTDSDYLLGVYGSKSWGSLKVSNSFNLNSVYSFSKSMISSFLYLLNWNFEISKQPSIIWGRVSYKGRPVAGAKVQLQNSNIKPIYFDKWIPSTDLFLTGRSGLFAFVGVKNGLSSLSAQFFGRTYNLKFIPVQSGKVSFVDVIESKIKEKKIITYDLFSNKIIKSRVKLLGTDKIANIEKEGVVSISQQSNGENLQLFEVVAKNPAYQKVSALSFSNKNQLEVPMLSRLWLKEIAKNIIQGAEHSIVVGLKGEGSNFSVSINPLLGAIPYQEHNIVYFDHQSKTYAQPNNRAIGFIAFNLPRGLYSANLVTRGGALLKTTTKLVISEPQSVQILKF